MKLAGIISTTALSLLLGMAAAPVYAQEQHEEQKDQQEQKDKAAKPEEKRTQQEEKPAKQEEKNAQQDKNAKHEEKNEQEQHARGNGGGRIPEDRFRANFGRDHSFRVSEGDYRNHRFQYGGYWFGFVDPWPSNWLYTQNVYVVDIGGVYYLCNPVYPGVSLAINVTL